MRQCKLFSLLEGENMTYIIKRYDEVDSTNEVAKRLLPGSDIYNNVVIVAKSQSQGKGRFGRIWHSPLGGLYTSIVQCSTFNVQLSTFNYGVAVAVQRAVQNFVYNNEPKIRIRFPNDIMIDNRKLGGILIETIYTDTQVVTSYIIGIGLNINTDRKYFDKSLSTDVAILSEYIQRKLDVDEILYEIIYQYEKILAEKPEEVIKSYKNVCSTIGKNIILYTIDNENINCILKDIDLDGNVIIQKEEETIKLKLWRIEMVRELEMGR